MLQEREGCLEIVKAKRLRELHLQQKYVARWRYNMGRLIIPRKGSGREHGGREVRREQEGEQEGREQGEKRVVIERG